MFALESLDDFVVRPTPRPPLSSAAAGSLEQMMTQVQQSAQAQSSQTRVVNLDPTLHFSSGRQELSSATPSICANQDQSFESTAMWMSELSPPGINQFLELNVQR